nr:replication protein A 70 kDa DNA-binding subunit D [Tanacetum cinerariifolium]
MLKKHKPKRKHTKEAEVPPTESQVKHNVPLPSPSHDPLPSVEGSQKLKELMDLCTKLSNKVLNLESEVLNIKSTYKAKIEKLESMVKRNHPNRRGKIADIDVDVEINLEKVQAEAYNLDLGHQEKVLSMMDVNNEEPTDVEEVLEVVKAAKLITKVVTTAGVDVNATSVQDTPITAAEATKVIAEVPKPRKRRCVIIQDPEETTTTTVTMQPRVQSKDKGKAILTEEPKPLKRQVQIDFDEEVTRQLEAELNADINWNAVIEQVKKVNEGIKVPKQEVRQEKDVKVESSKREGESLEQEIAKKQKMEQETKELKKHLQIVPDDDDVYTDDTPLALKIPIVDYKIHTERNRPYFKIIRADRNHRLFPSFSIMLKNFDREDLEYLWKIVRERFEKIEPKNYTDDYLLSTLKIMFEKPNVEANVMYPLTHFTLEQMVNNVRLEVDDESEMSLKLLRLVRRQLNECGIQITCLVFHILAEKMLDYIISYKVKDTFLVNAENARVFDDGKDPPMIYINYQAGSKFDIVDGITKDVEHKREVMEEDKEAVVLHVNFVKIADIVKPEVDANVDDAVQLD